MGNYAGGADDYSTAGYGEKAGGNLWDSVSVNSQKFLSSGRTTVLVTGGQVGKADGEKDGLPYGNIFGGCRGESAPNIFESPRYEYCPAFFTGYVNETRVTIGTTGQVSSDADAGQAGKAPLILGSVYGGGQDGHVRRDATVTIKSGVIGLEHTAANITYGLSTSAVQGCYHCIYRPCSHLCSYGLCFAHAESLGAVRIPHRRSLLRSGRILRCMSILYDTVKVHCYN